jgi:glycine dehydrogenase subunit 1
MSYDRKNGQINIEDLKEKISDKTAAVYIENPSYLGMIEEQVEEIGKEAHQHGALFIVGVDPTSLGILKPPGEYEADIVVGEAQPLGNTMNSFPAVEASPQDSGLISAVGSSFVSHLKKTDYGQLEAMAAFWNLHTLRN